MLTIVLSLKDRPETARTATHPHHHPSTNLNNLYHTIYCAPNGLDDQRVMSMFPGEHGLSRSDRVFDSRERSLFQEEEPSGDYQKIQN